MRAGIDILRSPLDTDGRLTLGSAHSGAWRQLSPHGNCPGLHSPVPRVRRKPFASRPRLTQERRYTRWWPMMGTSMLNVENRAKHEDHRWLDSLRD